jgi:hypothetical protein
VLSRDYGERLRFVYVDDVIRCRLRIHCVSESADPAELLTAVGSSCMPVRHRREVRERWLCVTYQG